MTTSSQRAKNIAAATKAARKSYNKFEIDKLSDIYKLFDKTADTLQLQIHGYEIAGKVPPARLQLILNNVTNELVQLRSTLNTMIRNGVSDVVDYNLSQQTLIMTANMSKPEYARLGSSYITKSGNVARYNSAIETYNQSSWYQTNTHAVNAVMSWKPGGETLSDTIWKLVIETERAIHNQVRIGIVTGESAQQLSQRIKPFLIKPDKRFRHVERDGKLVESEAMRNYNPGAGIYKSSYQNALRLARTEYGRAYTQGTESYAAANNFIQGFISRVGSSNPAPYDLSVNGKFFTKQEGIGIPYHPNCMCWAELVTIEVPASELKPGMSRVDYNRSILGSE